MRFNKKFHDWNMRNVEALNYHKNVVITMMKHYRTHPHAEPCLDGVRNMLQTEFYAIDDLQEVLKQCQHVMRINKLSTDDLEKFKQIERLIRYTIVRKQSSQSTYTRFKTLSFKK